MSINSRTKGASGEREFAGLIHDHLGIRLIRNLEQSRSGGHDLIVHPDEEGPVVDVLDGFALEIKRYQKATDGLLRRWWEQAEGQAGAIGKVPALAYRGNREPWRVVIPLSVMVTDIRDSGFLYTTSMGIEGFTALVRESVHD